MRATSPRRHAQRRTAGQVLALSVVTLLVLAFMMMLTFSVANAVHEKIRLQAHADAMAYSMATIEARAFNQIAYTNRTIAAVLVAQTTVHAYMAAASVTANMMSSGAENFQQIATMETIICMTCCTPPYCVSMCEHCIHAGEAMQISNDYSDAADDYANKVSNLDSDFNDIVQLLTTQVDEIHGSQKSAIEYLEQQILLGKDMDDVGKTNAPCASQLTNGVGDLNVGQLACALQGSHLDDACQNRPVLDRENRGKIMGDAANAARAEFGKARGFFPMHLGMTFLQEFMTDIPGSDGFTMPIQHSGTAKVMDGTSSGDCESSDQGVPATTVCAVESGQSFSYFKHGIGSSGYSAEVYSDANGGKHEPSDAHGPDHDKFKGVQREQDDDRPDCLTDGNCFITFDAEDSAGTDWGQPKVYAHYSQDLRIRDAESCNGDRPWELGDDGQLTIGDGQRGDGTLTFYPQETGRAVSKALVYFHRFDTWQAPPTLFDPYWRAKLHPFDIPDELVGVLRAASESTGDTLTQTVMYRGQL